MQWLCKQCGTLHTQNPEECRNCGHQIFEPVEDHNATKYNEGIESPEPMDSEDIEVLSIGSKSKESSSMESATDSGAVKSDSSDNPKSGNSLFDKLRKLIWNE